MNVRFRSPAHREMADAFEWYELARPGWGKRFSIAMAKTIQRIRSFPLSAPARRDGARRALVSGNPYAIWYAVIEDGLIEIYAIAHTSREPDYWTNRL